jgi:dTDP-4-dehydrorhamnose reductase
MSHKRKSAMRMMVIGADGQLGTDITEYFKNRCDLIPLTLTDLDITHADAVRQTMERIKPDVVANTAAYHHTEMCERNPLLAFQVNAVAVRDLALAAERVGAKVVHFSTDYVFDGLKNTPYTETDCPNPVSVYGVSKRAGELLLMNVNDRHLILRISGIYGKARCMAKGGNFINSMLRLVREKKPIRVVTDEILTPTSTMEICKQLDVMLQHGLSGIYHVTNEGSCSWHAFAKEIFTCLNLGVDVQEARVADFPITIKRPHYSVLENAKLKSMGLNIMSDWKTALHDFLAKVKVEEL